jgi:hypothetical protein
LISPGGAGNLKPLRHRLQAHHDVKVALLLAPTQPTNLVGQLHKMHQAHNYALPHALLVAVHRSLARVAHQ